MYLLVLRQTYILFLVLFGKISAPGGKDKNTDVCDGVLYDGMCYWTEPPPGGKKPVNCSGGELAWVYDNQTWQFITTNLDTELRTYSRLNLGIYSTPITGTQINTNEWFTLYGKRVNLTDPDLKADLNSCVVLANDRLQDDKCDNGIMSLCQSSNVSVCYNKTMILNKCYWEIPELKTEDSRSIFAKEMECVRLGGTLAVPESQNISAGLGLRFSDDKYYIGIVNRLWFDLYTGQLVQNHFWFKDVDNNDCAVMENSYLKANWRTVSCSANVNSYAGLCAKDVEKGEVCSEDNTTTNTGLGNYRCIRYYGLTSSGLSMESAKQQCEDGGGYLTYGKNDEEQFFLTNYINDIMHMDGVWIGITTTKRKWYNSKGEQSWFNWNNPYSQDTCLTFSSFDNYKWSISCSEPIIPGLTTSAPKKGPKGGPTESSLTTGNLCMKEDSSVISTTLLTTTTVENQTTTDSTTKAETTQEPTIEAQTSPNPTTKVQITPEPTTKAQTTPEPTSKAQTTSGPTVEAQTTPEPITEAQTNPETPTILQTTSEPITVAQLSLISKTFVLPDPTTFKPIGFTKPTLTKDEKCHKITMDPESKQSRSINCLCPCNCKRRKNQVHTLNEHTIEQFQEEIKKELILPQQSISAVTQKKISLPDKRVSSTSIGTASVVTIIGVLLTLVVADLFKIFLEIKRRMRYFSNQR